MNLNLGVLLHVLAELAVIALTVAYTGHLAGAW